MPSLEGRGYGQAEKEWAGDLESDKPFDVQWQEAEDKLRVFLDEKNANTSMIDLEDYGEYLEAAIFYQKLAENHRGDLDNNLLQAANSLVDEAPTELSELVA